RWPRGQAGQGVGEAVRDPRASGRHRPELRGRQPRRDRRPPPGQRCRDDRSRTCRPRAHAVACLKFLIDSMLPPAAAEMLEAAGHNATTPYQLGAHNLTDDVLIQLADDDGRVIVTENACGYCGVTT